MPDTLAPPANDALPLQNRGELRFLTCGSVDDGKSTLIGRMINDASGLLEDQIKSLQDDSRRFGTNGDAIDFALLLDGLDAEREQGITIDVAYRFFSTARRAFVVADTPGHQQYTRNMATGASNAELAVLLVDARKGLLEQTRRHAAIVSLLGIRHIVLAVNKIDLVEYSEVRFREISAAFESFAVPLAFHSVVAVPLSARLGDNVVFKSERTPWYKGPPLLAHLETVETDPEADAAPLRFPVQWVNRPNADFRGFSGTIASGRVAVGDKVVVAGSGRASEVVRIVTFDGDLKSAATGRSVTLILKDEIDIVRGDVLADPRDRPVVTRRFAADLVWMDDESATSGHRYLVKIGTTTVPATLSLVADRLEIDTLKRSAAQTLDLNAIGRVEIETGAPIAFDPYGDNRGTGAFILIDRSNLRTVAAGMIEEGLNAARTIYSHSEVPAAARRAEIKGQRPLIVWLTGSSSQLTSAIARSVEAHLTGMGRHTMLLDGEADVFHLARAANLLADAGLIVIAVSTSPRVVDGPDAYAFPDRVMDIQVDTGDQQADHIIALVLSKV
jgi:bifunctional enzyme CysN/CysC